MRIVIAGASGLIGRALTSALRQSGHRCVQLVRRPVRGEEEVSWDPSRGQLAPEALGKVDAVINLAGENVGDGRWTSERRLRIRQSRIDATRTLVTALASLPQPPTVLVNASAIGIYGNRGDEVITEASRPGDGFLHDVCTAWEAEAARARERGTRVVLARLGVVLARDGGALAKLRPLFSLGLGGRIGNGRQWMSWVSLDDVVGFFQFALTESRLAGPVNVTAPEPVTNADFTATLARVLRRPAVLPVPAVALRIAVGRGMADEALLGGARVLPQQLQEHGYVFRQPSLEGALQSLQL